MDQMKQPSEPPGASDPKDCRHREYREGRRVLLPDNAAPVRKWLEAGRGVALWRNQEIGRDVGQCVMTPARTEAGETYPSPHWKYGREPEHVFTASAAFCVELHSPVAKVKPKPNGGIRRSDVSRYGIDGATVVAFMSRDGDEWNVVHISGYANLEDWQPEKA